MATLKVFDGSGKEKGTVSIETVEPRVPVLHRAVVAEEVNKRQGTQKAKTRAEVRGGGRKPYRQKKTGRARQGSIRAPQYAHGGMVFAPRPRDYEKKINRKERRLALRSAFSARAEDGSVVVVEKIEFKEPKTKEAAALLRKVGANASRVLVILDKYDSTALKAFRNLPNVEVRTAPLRTKEQGEQVSKGQPFSTRDLLVARRIVVARDALAAIKEGWS